MIVLNSGIDRDIYSIFRAMDFKTAFFLHRDFISVDEIYPDSRELSS